MFRINHKFFGEANYQHLKLGNIGDQVILYKDVIENQSTSTQFKSSIASIGADYSFNSNKRFSFYCAPGAGLDFNMRYSVVNQSRIAAAKIRQDKNISPFYYLRVGIITIYKKTAGYLFSLIRKVHWFGIITLVSLIFHHQIFYF